MYHTYKYMYIFGCSLTSFSFIGVVIGDDAIRFPIVFKFSNMQFMQMAKCEWIFGHYACMHANAMVPQTTEATTKWIRAEGAFNGLHARNELQRSRSKPLRRHWLLTLIRAKLNVIARMRSASKPVTIQIWIEAAMNARECVNEWRWKSWTFYVLFSGGSTLNHLH